MKLESPEQLPEMLDELGRQRFYGDLHITFRHGEITRVVTEHSQVFNSTKGRPYSNEPHHRTK